MKKLKLNLGLLLASISSVGILSAQTLLQIPQSTGEKCAAHLIHDRLMSEDPVMAQKMEQFETYVKNFTPGFAAKLGAAQYKIPVVVHILHKGEAVGTGTNVTDADVIKAIRNLNERYRKTLTGLGGVDMEIEYVLAVRDPQGNCTNGITRVNMNNYSNTSVKNTYLASGVQASTSTGITDAQLKAVTSWDKNKYYNIYLVSEFDNNDGGAGVQGYAYFASSHGQSNDGAAILASNFTADFTMTTTHELGHALNLYHTFEGDGSGNTCPTNSSPTTQGDRCADTPPHRRSQSDCNSTGTNSCVSPATSNSLFVHNYMDYSSDACVNMFTNDQKTRALAACSGSRASFFNANNLALVPVSAPTVEFSASSNMICGTGAIQFYDESACVPNTYLEETSFSNITHAWTFTSGSTTLTSSKQNPIMNFTVAGTYDVTLTVTTPAGTHTITKPGFVVVGASAITMCSPTSSNAGNYGQTISNVKFNTINKTSDSYANTAYTNNTCSANTIVYAGETHTLNVTANAGPSGAERVAVYIDWNNNGTFDASESVLTGQVAAGSNSSINTQTLTASITIPATAVKNVLLRMRVAGDAQNVSLNKVNCSGAFTIGDVEDYGIMVKEECTVAPVITAQPAAVTECAGITKTFSVTATSATSYKWQSSTNGTTWTDLTNANGYSNVTTATMSVVLASTMNNLYYRCVTTNTCGTTNSSSVQLTVNSAPTATMGSIAAVCKGTSPITLNQGSPAGGTYSGTGVSGTTFNPTTAGTFVITYTVTEGGCSGTATTNMVVNNTPNVSFASVPTKCTTDSPFTLTQATPTGGTYSGPGVTNNVFNPATAGVGTHAVTYTVTTNGCTGTGTRNITVQSCLSVDDVDANVFVIYPNPVQGMMTIEGENLMNYSTVEVVDQAGRTIGTWEINAAKMLIDLATLADGNYTVRVKGSEKVISKKIQVIK